MKTMMFMTTYVYICFNISDFTVDPIAICWQFDRKTKKRKVLGDIAGVQRGLLFSYPSTSTSTTRSST